MRLVREWHGTTHVVTIDDKGRGGVEWARVDLAQRYRQGHHRQQWSGAGLLRSAQGDRAMKPIRCAIYTRKSSEEGLEQDFNSLDAQYGACSAYVASQASEGWVLAEGPL